MTIAEARAYVEQAAWRFAKTMPTIPHWYTVVSWVPESEPAFRAFVLLIRRIRNDGIRIPWPPPPAKAIYNHPYLFLDGWKYWAMEADTTQTILINRARQELTDQPFLEAAAKTSAE